MASYKTRWYEFWKPKIRTQLSLLEDYLNERRALSEELSGVDAVGKAAKGKGISLSEVLHKLRSNVVKIYSFIRRGSFQSSDWNLTQIQNALQTESIFRRSVEKYVEQMWKNGFEWVGQNPQTINYIRKRFSQMTQVTGKTTLELFQEMGMCLVTFANAFVVKQRNAAASGGRKYVTFDGQVRVPIAGYRIVDPATMWVDKDEYGNAKRWKQYLQNLAETVGAQPEWPPYNVIHIQDRTATSPKYFFAMPMAVPVIPDIKALRESEELSLLQSIKFAIPKFHAKVGEKDKPGTQPEIDATVDLLNSLPADGVLVTSNRVQVENISSEDGQIEMTPMQEYWRGRILAGLGMSDVGMGRGESSSRATAQVISAEMQNTTIKFQQILKASIEEHMVKELLFEAGFRPETIDETNMVHLHIPEIDLEQKIKREAHSLQKWQSNAITQDELRKELGKDVLNDEQQKELYLYLVQIPLAEAEARARALKATQRAVSNTNQPENQYGRSLAKPRIAKDDFEALRAQVTDPKITTRQQILEIVDRADIDNYAREVIKGHLRFAFAADEDGLFSPVYIAKIIFETLNNYVSVGAGGEVSSADDNGSDKE